MVLFRGGRGGGGIGHMDRDQYGLALDGVVGFSQITICPPHLTAFATF